ncbi:hypothetical protein ACFQ51_39010 [Streptomyces kaempferi]
MRVAAAGGVVGVHGGRGQPRYGVDQGMLGCDRQGVGPDHLGRGRRRCRPRHAGLADPPHPDLPDAADAVHRAQRISIVYALYDHHVAELLDQALFHVEHLRLGLRDTPEPAAAATGTV